MSTDIEVAGSLSASPPTSPEQAHDLADGRGGGNDPGRRGRAALAEFMKLNKEEESEVHPRVGTGS